MSFTQDENSKEFFMVVDGKKNVSHINVENIDLFTEIEATKQLQLVYHIAEESTGSLFSKSKEVTTRIVKKEDYFESTENEKILKAFKAIQSKAMHASM